MFIYSARFKERNLHEGLVTWWDQEAVDSEPQWWADNDWWSPWCWDQWCWVDEDWWGPWCWDQLWVDQWAIWDDQSHFEVKDWVWVDCSELIELKVICWLMKKSPIFILVSFVINSCSRDFSGCYLRGEILSLDRWNMTNHEFGDWTWIKTRKVKI